MVMMIIVMLTVPLPGNTLDGDGSADIKDDMPFVMTLMLWLLMMLLVLSLLW